MADYTFFTVTGKYDVLVSDGPDAGNEPDLGVITGIVTFTPEVSVVATRNMTPATIAVLQPIQGRIEEDGILKSIDGTPGVKLVANTSVLALDDDLRYRVTYSQMRWEKMDRHLDGFTFIAPTVATTTDIRDLFANRA